MARHTYEMGMIGNCASNALIDIKGNVKWLCWPRPDSSFVFGSLLDTEKGGCFSIIPLEQEFQTHQYYLQNTNILCTEVFGSWGRYRITDFMPRFLQNERYFKPLMFIRKLEWLEGDPQLKVVCNPVYDYGKQKSSVELGSNHLRYTGFGHEVRLTTNVSLNYILEEKFFGLSEPRYLVLTFGIPLEGPLERTSEDFLHKTTNYWQNWVKQSKIGEFNQEYVIRSALTLKMHQFEDTGAIIASATTSLPESPHANRNWDYRYCWMRDSFYTLKGLHEVGHFHEMEKYARYISDINVGSEGRYHPVYNLMGDTNFPERELELHGYMGNQPVRVGNEARNHIQNDVYGEILVSLLPLYVDKRFVIKKEFNSLPDIAKLLQMIELTMDEPDAGLWEFRNVAQKHAFTYFFHWAGSNAALRIANTLGDKKMGEHAMRLIKQSSDRLEGCYNPKIGAYTQAIGSDNLDASLLQLITMNYLNPYSDRARNHLKAIEERLMTSNGLLYRYIHKDDFGYPETTFLVCSFWHVEALACVGRLDEAIERFDQLMKFSNHLGLFSEDVAAADGSQWGNFPQTYSHVGLMNAAFRIADKIGMPSFLSDKN